MGDRTISRSPRRTVLSTVSNRRSASEIMGERWPVPRGTFDISYAPVAPNRAGKPGPYRKRPHVVWAKPMTDTFDVTLDGDRGTLRGERGDWLVQYAPSDLSVVSARVPGIPIVWIGSPFAGTVVVFTLAMRSP